jgi:hypothetical protein
VALGLAGTLERQGHHLLVNGCRNLAAHACGSMCHYNFAGGPVLGNSPPMQGFACAEPR